MNNIYPFVYFIHTYFSRIPLLLLAYIRHIQRKVSYSFLIKKTPSNLLVRRSFMFKLESI